MRNNVMPDLIRNPVPMEYRLRGNDRDGLIFCRSISASAAILQAEVLSIPDRLVFDSP
jgi:hypothetical protein